MNDKQLDNGLGGRLPLLEPSKLEGPQRDLFDYLVGSKINWATRSGFTGQLADGRMIGPFNVFLYSPDMARAFNAWADAESAHTSLAPDIRQVVILTVGAAWNAPYEVYAHVAVARRSDVTEETIAAITAGREPVRASSAVQLAYRFTHELVVTRGVNDELYSDTVGAFGEKGVADMVNLVGLYLATSALLNAFRVPAPGA